MRHDPLTLHEIDLHIRKARELRASYEAEFPDKFFDAIRHALDARWRFAVAAIAVAVLMLAGLVTIASAHRPRDFAELCAKREIAVMKAIADRAAAPDTNDILGRARTTMQTAHRWCAEGRRTQADALYNYVLRRVTTLRVG